MDGIGAVRVVLGEGEPGILRLVLEAEGFQVVGQARGEEELRRVLDVTRPSVIVLDAGISAQAALEARGRGSGTALVVVWPADVVPALADERVDPSSVLQELGAAVRRAARRAPRIPTESVVIIPDLPSVGNEPTVPRSDAVRRIHPAAPARSRRRGGVLIAAALTVALTASAAIGLVVPRAMRNFHLFEGGRSPAVSPATSGARQPSTDRVDPDTQTPNGSNDDRDCGRSDERAEAPRTDPGKPEAAGTCGKGQGRPEHAGSSGTTDKGNKGGVSQGGGGSGVGYQDGVTNGGGNGGGNHGNGGGGKQDGASQDSPTDGGSASGADGGGSGDPTSHGKATGRSGDEASGGEDHPGNSGGKP